MKLGVLKRIVNRYGDQFDDYDVFIDVFTDTPGKPVKLGLLGCTALSYRDKTFHLTGEIEPTNNGIMNNLNDSVINQLNGIR